MKKRILTSVPVSELVDQLFEKIKEANLFQQTNRKKEKQFLSINEFCEEYGFKKPTIYALTSGQKIPYYRAGKNLKFHRPEIEKWILSFRVKTKKEIKEEFKNELKNKGGSNDEK